MDSKLLQLSANSAIEDKNFPHIWQAWLVNLNRNGTTGWNGINLDEIEISEQIGNTFKARNANGDFPPADFTPFETAYKTPSEKLRSQAFEYGFLL